MFFGARECLRGLAAAHDVCERAGQSRDKGKARPEVLISGCFGCWRSRRPATRRAILQIQPASPLRELLIRAGDGTIPNERKHNPQTAALRDGPGGPSTG